MMRFVVHQNCLIRVNKHAPLLQRRAALAMLIYMLLTNGGAHLCASSTIPTYLFQLTHHPLLSGSKEALVVNLQADH